mgnify:CR=1 FL=1
MYAGVIYIHYHLMSLVLFTQYRHNYAIITLIIARRASYFNIRARLYMAIHMTLLLRYNDDISLLRYMRLNYMVHFPIAAALHYDMTLPLTLNVFTKSSIYFTFIFHKQCNWVEHGYLFDWTKGPFSLIKTH